MKTGVPCERCVQAFSTKLGLTVWCICEGDAHPCLVLCIVHYATMPFALSTQSPNAHEFFAISIALFTNSYFPCKVQDITGESTRMSGLCITVVKIDAKAGAAGHIWCLKSAAGSECSLSKQTV